MEAHVRTVRWALLLLAVPVYAYSGYLTYIVLTGPLPNLDARGHLYLLVGMIPLATWPLVPLSSSRGRAVALFFASVTVSYSSMYFGARFSESHIASVAVYAAGVAIVCWVIVYLRKTVRSHNGRGGRASGPWLQVLVLVSFIWFLLKVAWHAGGLLGPYYAVAASTDVLLVLATYALLFSSVLASLGGAVLRRACLLQAVLFVCVVHLVAKGDFQMPWLAENIVVVMMLTAMLSLRRAAKGSAAYVGGRVTGRRE